MSYGEKIKKVGWGLVYKILLKVCIGYEMNKVIIILLYSTSLFASAKYDFKTQWLNVINREIREEEARFFALYGLPKSCLANTEMESELRRSHDTLVDETIARYKVVPWWRRIFDRITTVCQQNAETIQESAISIFKSVGIDSVEVIHTSKFDRNQICVMQKYTNNQCYLVLNAALLSDLAVLKSFIWHETSHIMHEDNFVIEMLQCTAWCHSNASKAEVVASTNSLHRLFEKRADIWAAIHAPRLISSLILEMDTWPKNEFYVTHPSPAERIDMLKKIKLDYDSL